MHLLAPDIVAEARGLSPAIPAAGVGLGLLLWLFGSVGHRFWFVLLLTLGAGVYGLYFGPAYGMQPLVAGLLLAVSTGTLGLALMRVLAFGAGGLAALWLARAVAPAYDEPLVFFLLGGLAGVLLLRIWVTALSSLAGTLLAAYSSLCLLDRFGKLDSVAWVTQHGAMLNWAVGAFAVLGVAAQYLLQARRRRLAKARAEQLALAAEAEAARRTVEAHTLRASSRPWWRRPFEPWRRAG